ncbi:MAG: FAD-binding dehydrogenase [Desulforegulaceae bacterium]|nr:FAD-binding dehydrogenase [Desulforegulaceae bacterium]
MPHLAKKYTTDIVIVGGGIAGLAAAFELLDTGKKILILDRDNQEKLGGLAKESFGGILAVDTPLQRKSGIKDSFELAYQDWKRYANFDSNSQLQKKWAKKYIEYSTKYIYEWLTDKGIKFLPVVNWPERGMFQQGNSVPRWHIAWGTGFEIIKKIIKAIEKHPNSNNLSFKFRHRVNNFNKKNDQINGCSGIIESTHAPFEVKADFVIAAAGGICGGDLSLVKKYWPENERGELPQRLLNGGHKFADGIVHFAAEKAGGQLKNLKNQWHYAAGVHYPDSLRENHGLSLVPPKSAVWINAHGKRIGPSPLMGYTDTKFLVDEILKQPGKFSWQIMNFKIAKKELAVSGCDYMTSFRKKQKFNLLKELLFGNKALVKKLSNNCDDFVVADSLEELVEKMNFLEPDFKIDKSVLKSELKKYDSGILRGKNLINDDQLRRIVSYRKYRGDRIRTCNLQTILDPLAKPFIAIREFILTRKSLGGIITDLESRILTPSGKPIKSFYAIGETAGFGGGGIHGQGSLEGTFLGGCLVTAQLAANSIKKNI